MKVVRFYWGYTWGRRISAACLLWLAMLAACSFNNPTPDSLLRSSSRFSISQAQMEARATPSATYTLMVVPSATFTLTATALPPHADWEAEQVLVVGKQAGAWLRQVPDSRSERIITVLVYGTEVTVNTPPYFDGVQWWWIIETANGYSGWVEQAALAPTASETWQLGQRLQIQKAQGVWLRGMPSSASDDIVAVLPNGSLVTVSGEPVHDGVQWWWPVIANGEQSGWVEQDGLTPYAPPTALPRTAVPIVPIVPTVPPPDSPNVMPTVEQPPHIPATPFSAPPQQPPPPTQVPVTPPPPQQPPTVEFPPPVTATTEFPSDGTVEFPPTGVAIMFTMPPDERIMPAQEGGDAGDFSTNPTTRSVYRRRTETRAGRWARGNG